MKNRTSTFGVLTMAFLAIASFSLIPSAPGGPHQWVTWTQGVLRDVDVKGKCLTLESGKTNCVIRWSTGTRQWEGVNDSAPNGHPLTPDLWRTGQLVRVLTETKNKN